MKGNQVGNVYQTKKGFYKIPIYAYLEKDYLYNIYKEGIIAKFAVYEKLPKPRLTIDEQIKQITDKF